MSYSRYYEYGQEYAKEVERGEYDPPTIVIEGSDEFDQFQEEYGHLFPPRLTGPRGLQALLEEEARQLLEEWRAKRHRA